jgi:site-specific DNA-adenine methylase
MVNHHCEICGYECQLAGSFARWCPVCWTGLMLPGRAASGSFNVVNDDAVPLDPPPGPLRPDRIGNEIEPTTLGCFTGINGKPYWTFIRNNTTFLREFTNLWVPERERYAWLSPYLGNKHNRAFFTQLVIATVARAVFRANRGRFPRFIEPFVGSGQVFLNACTWGPVLNAGVPSFVEVIAGDLNHYLIAAYDAMLRSGKHFVTLYVEHAKEYDDDIRGAQAVYKRNQLWLGGYGRDSARNRADPAGRDLAAFDYIWTVNRTRRGTSLNRTGGVTGTMGNGNLGKIREREADTLTAIGEVLPAIRLRAAHRDFQQTCALAGPSDLVFLDCPFPKFTNVVPRAGQTHRTESANTYGTGEDGEGLQSRIIDEAARLVEQGTTVIICNFANPGLVLDYRKLIRNNVAEAAKRDYVYTYKAPSMDSTLYQLAILPGRGKDLSGVPRTLRASWLAAVNDETAAMDVEMTG